MKRQDLQIEVCANGVESCVAAQAGGADRVELCAGMSEGGTTPSYGEILTARKLLQATKLHVIIRPRGGNFAYTPLELERMVADIEICRQLGVDGVVFGCLTPDGDIDTKACQQLLQHVGGMGTTFHRAFDRCHAPLDALDTLVGLGFDRILTSGQQPTAEQGIPLLAQLCQYASNRIAILAGSGINEQNIARICAETHVREFHFSAREPIGAGDEEFGSQQMTSARKVEAIIQQLLT